VGLYLLKTRSQGNDEELLLLNEVYRVLLLSAGGWHSTERKRDVYGRDGGNSSAAVVVCYSGGRDPATMWLLLIAYPNMIVSFKAITGGHYGERMSF